MPSPISLILVSTRTSIRCDGTAEGRQEHYFTIHMCVSNVDAVSILDIHYCAMKKQMQKTVTRTYTQTRRASGAFPRDVAFTLKNQKLRLVFVNHYRWIRQRNMRASTREWPAHRNNRSSQTATHQRRHRLRGTRALVVRIQRPSLSFPNTISPATERVSVLLLSSVACPRGKNSG